MEKSIIFQLGKELQELRSTYRSFKPLSIQDAVPLIQKESQKEIPVFLPGGWINSLGCARGIGRNGYQSIVLDPSPDALSFYSKYVYPVQISNCFNMTVDEEHVLLSELLLLGKSLKQIGKIPVLFLIASEKLLPFIISNLESLSEEYLFTADYRKQYTLEDKQAQLNAANACGIPTPKSFFPETEDEYFSYAQELDFPFILKPRKGKEFFSAFGVQAFRVHDLKELRELYKKVKDFHLILQEEIPGEDSNLFTLGSYVNEKNEVKAVFTGKKLKSNRDLGTCSLGISTDSPDVRSLGLKFLDHVNYHGASQIEFKFDERDNKYKFIEINNRLWKWHSLAIESGVNLPFIQFLDTIGKLEQNELPEQRNGVRWWMSVADTYSIIKESSRDGHSLKDSLQDVDFDFVDGIGSWDDPLPALVNFFKFKWIN